MSESLISIIDDDESMLLALASLLRSYGFVVRTFVSAEEFIQSGADSTSSCIVTDLQMSGMSGMELKQWLDTHACFTPVIMITARSERDLDAQALASGAVCLLRKPFEADALLACLRRANVAWPPGVVTPGK